ncbi:MAG: YybH family protein [Gammaproteobacteria bacterium]
MRTLFILLSLLLPLTSFAVGKHSDIDMTQVIKDYRELNETEQAVQSVLDTYARAMEEKSIEVMEQAVIVGDFSTIESGYANWTWEDFRDNHLAVEIETFGDVDYQIDLVVGETQGSLGFALFKYTASGKVHGKTVSISGLGTAVLEETDDGWRIHHLHTSAPRDQLEQAAKGTGHQMPKE